MNTVEIEIPLTLKLKITIVTEYNEKKHEVESRVVVHQEKENPTAVGIPVEPSVIKRVQEITVPKQVVNLPSVHPNVRFEESKESIDFPILANAKRIHCDGCPDCGRGHCQIRHRRSENGTIYHCKNVTITPDYSGEAMKEVVPVPSPVKSPPFWWEKKNQQDSRPSLPSSPVPQRKMSPAIAALTPEQRAEKFDPTAPMKKTTRNFVPMIREDDHHVGIGKRIDQSKKDPKTVAFEDRLNNLEYVDCYNPDCTELRRFLKDAGFRHFRHMDKEFCNGRCFKDWNAHGCKVNPKLESAPIAEQTEEDHGS